MTVRQMVSHGLSDSDMIHSSRPLGYKARIIESIPESAALHAVIAREKLVRKDLAARILNSWAVEDEHCFDRIAWANIPRHMLDSAEFVAAARRWSARYSGSPHQLPRSW